MRASCTMNTTASSACFCDPTRNEDDSADTDSESSPWNASDYQQYVEYDDELWGGFPEASLVSVLFGSVLLVGLTGNGIVVYVVVRSWAMRTVTNLYFLNLAIADLLVLVFCAPFTASVYLLPTWPFGAVACKSLGACVFSLFFGLLLHEVACHGASCSQVGITFQNSRKTVLPKASQGPFSFSFLRSFG